ncbi:hypothetical protein BZA05DRAFT_448364 [Tricharina praecox]|uniref:uncharacterized protein n=1 Tax=Tricharina praecox TaxID=43433 RepID=UPI00222047C6|nr:uncharacterized protein BZA05DRAFT_448364 [Tricharina praecox]KAI5844275.1 hypothetical protein BZA05DRAFT_448364 [Tricharina praecox]
MFPGFLFIAVRIFEIISLIPIWGMLAWFVDLYQPATPPDYILYPFIVALLATIWAIITLLMYRRMGWTPIYIAIVDLCWFGILIGGVVVLAPWVRRTDCVQWQGQSAVLNAAGMSVTSGDVTVAKQCMMLKSSWGLAILNIILFFASAVLAWEVWHRTGVVVVRPRRSRSSRRNNGW